MTHFATLVLTESGEVDEVERLLAPYDENGEWFADGSRWDWWVVGGRFTGFFDDYDPVKDPENMEMCDLCGGTGDRATWRGELPERQHPSGCNGCLGNGLSLKWPTEWKDHDGDIAPVRALQVDAWPYVPGALVTPDGKWHERARSGWFGTTIENEDGEGEKPEALWTATVKALLEQHPTAIAVVVDCHI